MFVKTAHKGFPRDQSNETDLSRGDWVGDWVAYHATIDDIVLQARAVLRPEST